MTTRSTFEVINAYNATMIKGGFEAKIRELQAAHQDDIYRNDLTYTARELDSNLPNVDSSVSRYLIIGYTFREDDPIYMNNRTFARYSENELVGETRPSEQHVIRWARCKTPILVVTPIKENTGTSIRLFGLVMPRSGLCQPVLLTHERIFYRWEYRASAGARSNQRNKNWNQIIIDKALSLTPADAKPRAVPMVSERRRSHETMVKQEDDDTYYLDSSSRPQSEGEMLELNLDLDALFEPLSDVYGVINTVQISSPTVVTCFKIVLNSGEIQGLLHAIRRTRNDRIRSEVEIRLHYASQMKGKLPEEYPALVRFADAGFVDFGVELAFDVAANIKKLWPPLGQLANVDNLIRIKHIVNRNQQSLSSECLENVFRMMLSAVAYNDQFSAEDLQGRLREAMFSSQMMQSSSRRGIATVNTEYAPLSIDASFLVMLLKDALAIHEWQQKATSQLAQNIPASFQGQVFEHVINIEMSHLNPDDVREALRWLVNHARSKSCDVDDILLWLERLRLRIRQT